MAGLNLLAQVTAQSMAQKLRNKLDQTTTKFQCVCSVLLIVIIALAVTIIAGIIIWCIVTKGKLFTGLWFWGLWRLSVWVRL